MNDIDHRQPLRDHPTYSSEDSPQLIHSRHLSTQTTLEHEPYQVAGGLGQHNTEPRNSTPTPNNLRQEEIDSERRIQQEQDQTLFNNIERGPAQNAQSASTPSDFSQEISAKQITNANNNEPLDAIRNSNPPTSSSFQRPSSIPATQTNSEQPQHNSTQQAGMDNEPELHTNTGTNTDQCPISFTSQNNDAQQKLNTQSSEVQTANAPSESNAFNMNEVSGNSGFKKSSGIFRDQKGNEYWIESDGRNFSISPINNGGSIAQENVSN
jgi:hypothetical protein